MLATASYDLLESKLVVAVIAASFAILGSLLAAFTNQYLQNNYKNKQYRREKLLEKYAELVGVTITSLDINAKISGLADSTIEEHWKDPGLKTLMGEISEKHSDNRRDLFRLCLQIRLLESNQCLIDCVSNLTSGLPNDLGILPPRHNDEEYRKNLNKFISDKFKFNAKMGELNELVIKIYRK